jgi:DNA-binding transcriptional ArsR family regulator
MLTPEDLNESDEQILDQLVEGRVSPSFVVQQTDLHRSYVSQRLIRLKEHGHVEELVRGLYELDSDPRDTEESEGTPQTPA